MNNKGSDFIRVRNMKLYRDNIECGGYSIILHKVPNNYGGRDRLYFECPYCEKQVRYLYLCNNDKFKCRVCAKLNYASQRTTKGCDLAAYKMEKFLRKKFKVKEDLAPVDMSVCKPERPKGMHRQTYYKHIKQLFELQDEYDRQFNIKAMKIAGWRDFFGDDIF